MTWGRFQLAGQCALVSLWKSREKCTGKEAIAGAKPEYSGGKPQKRRKAEIGGNGILMFTKLVRIKARTQRGIGDERNSCSDFATRIAFLPKRCQTVTTITAPDHLRVTLPLQ